MRVQYFAFKSIKKTCRSIKIIYQKQKQIKNFNKHKKNKKINRILSMNHLQNNLKKKIKIKRIIIKTKIDQDLKVYKGHIYLIKEDNNFKTITILHLKKIKRNPQYTLQSKSNKIKMQRNLLKN